jgi:hypothetical protein
MFGLIEKRRLAIEGQASRRHMLRCNIRTKESSLMFMSHLDRTLMIAAVLLAALPIAALVTGGVFA